MSMQQPGIGSTLGPKYTLCFGPKVRAIKFPVHTPHRPIIVRMFKHKIGRSFIVNTYMPTTSKLSLTSPRQMHRSGKTEVKKGKATASGHCQLIIRHVHPMSEAEHQQSAGTGSVAQGHFLDLRREFQATI